MLAGGLETWTDTVLDLLAQDFHRAVPAAAPAGPMTAERRELTRRTADALGVGAHAPARAAEALAAAVERALIDVHRLRVLRDAGQEGEYATGLAAHVELLAAFTIAAAPLMPGWSAFLAGELGLAVDRETRLPLWADEDERLVPAGTVLPESRTGVLPRAGMSGALPRGAGVSGGRRATARGRRTRCRMRRPRAVEGRERGISPRWAPRWPRRA